MAAILAGEFVRSWATSVRFRSPATKLKNSIWGPSRRLGASQRGCFPRQSPAALPSQGSVVKNVQEPSHKLVAVAILNLDRSQGSGVVSTVNNQHLVFSDHGRGNWRVQFHFIAAVFER